MAEIDNEEISKKSSLVTTILLLLFGSAGIHRIYVGRYISGIFIFVVKCTLLVLKHFGWKWHFILNVICYGMLLFDLYGLYSDSFTDGKGKIVTGQEKYMTYNSEKERMQKKFEKKLNNIMCLCIAILYYAAILIINNVKF